MMLGHAGVVRLSHDEDVESGLGIAEGIETALAIMANIDWRPVWACLTTGAIERFPILGGVECLTIFADPKPREMEGARACAKRWKAAGREVAIELPPADRGDWNSVLGAV
jgi:hypothetical protein